MSAEAAPLERAEAGAGAMTARERVLTIWAEWAPSYRKGRLEIGRMVILSRSEVHQLADRNLELGMRLERERPGTLRRWTEDRPRHLHSV